MLNLGGNIITPTSSVTNCSLSVLHSCGRSGPVALVSLLLS